MKITKNWWKAIIAISVPAMIVTGASVGIIAATSGFTKKEHTMQTTPTTTASKERNLSALEKLDSINKDLGSLTHEEIYLRMLFVNDHWFVSLFNSSNIQSRTSIINFNAEDPKMIADELWSQLGVNYPIIALQKKEDWKSFFDKLDSYIASIENSMKEASDKLATEFANASITRLGKENLLNYIKTLFKSQAYYGGELTDIIYNNGELSLQGSDEIAIRPIIGYTNTTLVEAVNKYAERFLTPPAPQKLYTRQDAKKVTAITAGKEGDKISIDSKEYTYYENSPLPQFVDASMKPFDWPVSLKINSDEDVALTKFWHFQNSTEFYSEPGLLLQKHAKYSDEAKFLTDNHVEQNITLPDVIIKEEDFFNGMETFGDIKVYVPQSTREDARAGKVIPNCYHIKDGNMEIYSTAKEPILAYLVGKDANTPVLHDVLPAIVDDADWQSLKKSITVDNTNVYWHTAKLHNPGFYAEVPHGSSILNVPKVQYQLDSSLYFTDIAKLNSFLISQFKLIS